MSEDFPGTDPSELLRYRDYASDLLICAVAHLDFFTFLNASANCDSFIASNHAWPSGCVRVIAGDMFKEIPEGYHVHLFANVLHDWDSDSVRRLLEMSYQALDDGGTIAVFDAHLNETKDGPLAVAEYSCLLMHSTVGRCYSVGEIQEMLSRAGFGGALVSDVAADRSVITAKKE